MDAHTIQLGYDSALHKHYARVINEKTGKEIYRTNLCKTIEDALQQVQKNVQTNQLKRSTPFTSEKTFPVIKEELKQRFCSS